MKRLTAALALALLSALVSQASADSVPKLDVARSCREAQAYSGEDNKLAYKGCMQDENEAYAQLQKNWPHYRPENRSKCVAQGVSPMPSYVEILTCIEMFDGASSFTRPGASMRPPDGAAPATAPASAAPSYATPAPETNSDGVK